MPGGVFGRRSEFSSLLRAHPEHHVGVLDHTIHELVLLVVDDKRGRVAELLEADLTCLPFTAEVEFPFRGCRSGCLIATHLDGGLFNFCESWWPISDARRDLFGHFRVVSGVRRSLMAFLKLGGLVAALRRCSVALGIIVFQVA